MPSVKLLIANNKKKAILVVQIAGIATGNLISIEKS